MRILEIVLGRGAGVNDTCGWEDVSTKRLYGAKGQLAMRWETTRAGRLVLARGWWCQS